MAAASGIEAFWAWWPDASGRIAASIEGGGGTPPMPLVEEITGRVRAISPDLDWELAPGIKARHAFCLSPKGDAELRRVTEKWLRAAPAAGEIWEHHPARKPRDVASLKLGIGDHQLDFSEFVAAFDVDETRELVDAVCFHPAFPEMPEELRSTATFLMLDAAFGEDGVERWFGSIESGAAAPEGARPLAELKAAVDALAESATGEKFGMLAGQTPEGEMLVAIVNRALKRIDHLACDTHLSVDVAILRPHQGLTTDGEAGELNAIEDELRGALGSAVAYFGRETGAGRRIVHWFLPGDGPARAAVEGWAARYPERDVRVEWTPDPRWEARSRFP